MFRELNALAFRELIVESEIVVAYPKGAAYSEAQRTMDTVRASVAGKVYDRLMPSSFFSADGTIDPRTLAVMSKSFVELKLLPKEQDLAQLVTDRFLPGKG